jgi:gas vesicle protein
LLLGALIGLVLALFLAPRSGAATRADLASRVQKARSRVREVTDEARLAVSDFAAWAAEADGSTPPASADTLSLATASPVVSRSKAPTGPLPQVSRTGEPLPPH